MAYRPITLDYDHVRELHDRGTGAYRLSQMRVPVTFSKKIRDEYNEDISEAYDVINATRGDIGYAAFLMAGDHGFTSWVRCPVGVVGDRLWVKEKWAVPGTVARSDDPVRAGDQVVYYQADSRHWSWRSPVTMPQWAARTVLTLTDVRAERLHKMTHEDAMHSAIDLDDIGVNWEVREQDALVPYKRYWDSKYAKKGFGWDKNPWVWAVTFEVENV